MQPLRSAKAALDAVVKFMGTLPRQLFSSRSHKDLSFFVSYVYVNILGRRADPDGLAYFVGLLRKGRPFARVVQEIDASPEAIARRRIPGPADDGSDDGLTDGEF